MFDEPAIFHTEMKARDIITASLLCGSVALGSQIEALRELQCDWTSDRPVCEAAERRAGSPLDLVEGLSQVASSTTQV